MRLFYQVWSEYDLISSTLSNQLENGKKLICPSLTDKSKSSQNVICSSVTSKLENDRIIAFLSISFTHHYEIITRIKEYKYSWYYILKQLLNFGLQGT